MAAIPRRPGLPRRLTSRSHLEGTGYETPMEPEPSSPMSAPTQQGGKSPFMGAVSNSGGGGSTPRRARADMGDQPLAIAVARVQQQSRAAGGGGGGGGGGISFREQRRVLGAGTTSPSVESLNGVMLRARRGVRKVGIRDRIGCFQWTWFTMTMVVCFLCLFVFW
jgi:hypothetical protein